MAWGGDSAPTSTLFKGQLCVYVCMCMYVHTFVYLFILLLGSKSSIGPSSYSEYKVKFFKGLHFSSYVLLLSPLLTLFQLTHQAPQ